MTDNSENAAPPKNYDFGSYARLEFKIVDTVYAMNMPMGPPVPEIPMGPFGPYAPAGPFGPYPT